MSLNPIITTSGKLTNSIFLVDVNQYSFPRICSSFILKTPESTIIMDTGTSFDVSSILEFMKSQGISLHSVTYLVPTHHHFDHFGGGWKLWEIIKQINSEVKVLTTEKTKIQLQSPENHVKNAKRTFGEFVGTMNPLPEEAFEIVDPDEPIKIQGLDKSTQFQLISTPGHASDHVCPTLFKNSEVSFMFLGEAAGSLLHSTKCVTLCTSMPPDFSHKEYMASLDKIIELNPGIVGYCHFGAIKGKKEVRQTLEDNKEYSVFFRNYVQRKYQERGETRYIVEQYMTEELMKRTDFPHKELITNVIVGVVYGQLVDLGLRFVE